MIVGVVFGLQDDLARWQAFLSLYISIHLEIDTTFQFCTLSSQLLRIHGDILVTGSTCRYRDEVGHPAGAAQFASTGTNTPNAAGLLTGSNLFHLNTYPKDLCQYLDQLTEIDPFVCNVVENSLVAVTLILYISNFHVEPQAGCNLAGTNHRVVFLGLCLFVLLNVVGFGLAIDLFRFDALHPYIVFLHLQQNQFPG